jgi:hypothetical protein
MRTHHFLGLSVLRFRTRLRVVRPPSSLHNTLSPIAQYTQLFLMFEWDRSMDGKRRIVSHGGEFVI